MEKSNNDELEVVSGGQKIDVTNVDKMLDDLKGQSYDLVATGSDTYEQTVYAPNGKSVKVRGNGTDAWMLGKTGHYEPFDIMSFIENNP